MTDWDSEFWGIENVRDRWRLVDSDNPREIKQFEQKGFHVTDIRVTFSRHPVVTDSYILRDARAFRPDDLDTLVRIARESHRITRFYADPHLPDERCHDLYEHWIRNSCEGWASRVFVADHDDKPAGYCTVHLDGETASIGLIAIDESARGHGLGSMLVRAASGYAKAAGCSEIKVVTQGRNITAQRLFQGCSFRVTRTEVWLHQHIYREGPVVATDGLTPGREIVIES